MRLCSLSGPSTFLEDEEEDNRIILFYKIHTHDLIPKNRRCGKKKKKKKKKKNSLALQIPSASTNAYFTYIVSPETIRDWNDLPDSLISYDAEMSDGCDLPLLRELGTNPLRSSPPAWCGIVNLTFHQ